MMLHQVSQFHLTGNDHIRQVIIFWDRMWQDCNNVEIGKVNEGNEMTGKRCYMQRNEECWEQVNYLVWIYDTTAEVILEEVQWHHHVHLWYIACCSDSPHFNKAGSTCGVDIQTIEMHSSIQNVPPWDILKLTKPMWSCSPSQTIYSQTSNKAYPSVMVKVGQKYALLESMPW